MRRCGATAARGCCSARSSTPNPKPKPQPKPKPNPDTNPNPNPKPHPNPNLGPEQHALYAAIEEAAARWFAQDEEAKEAQAGVYAHINRKFTGYRNGKFREQLELRQTQQGSLYPQVERRG